MVPLRGWIVPITAALILLGTGIKAPAADRPEKPSAYVCWWARFALTVTGSEEAAEKRARKEGISEATIASAKRCRR